MARKDKILDVLALQCLDVDARIANLAHKYVGQPFPIEQARAVIDCYFDREDWVNLKPHSWEGTVSAQDMAYRLYNEKLRQERLHNDRAALRTAAEKRSLSPMNRYKARLVGQREASANRESRRRKIAERIFGAHVKENFNEDTLALMSLLNGDVRKYNIQWLEGSSQPVPSALVKVTTQIIGGTVHRRTFLLYRIGERVLVARADKATTIQHAYAMQLPHEVVDAAPTLMADGFRFNSDLEEQQMVITAPDGLERIVEWKGRTVDE
jgi:hypothetical protein